MQAEETLPKLFAALGDATRFKIVDLLITDPGICVSNLAQRLELSVPAVSQQCKLLEMSGIVRRVRNGQQICYQIRQDDTNVGALLKIIKEK